MGSSSTDIAKQTQVMGLFAQILSAFGFVLLIIGACLTVIYLVLEIIGGVGSAEGDGFQIAEVMTSGGIMLNGILLVALGQVLKALRSIAMNCETMANKE